MWLAAGAFTLVLLIGGAYETWAVWYSSQARYRDVTITNLIRTRPHLMIVLSALFMTFGYVLGVGGR